MPGPLNFDPIAEAGRQWHDHWGPDTVAPVLVAVSTISRAAVSIAEWS